MANTGFTWGTAANALITGGTWSALDIGTAGTQTSLEIDISGKAGCEVGVKAIEDNTGACTGNFEIYILRTDNDPDSEGWQDANDKILVGEIDIAQAQTRRFAFSVDPGRVSSFKVYAINNSGQTLTTTVNYNTATVPLAS